MPNKEIVKIASVRKQKNPFLFIIFTFVLISVLFTGFWIIKEKVNHTGYKNVKIGNQIFKLEVADTEFARQKGLSERDYLAENTGMLFDFKTDADWRMWMLKMRFSIDIIWVDKASQIKHIKTNVQPGSYPEAYHANQSVRYVIEAPAGSIDKSGVKTGDYITIY